MKYRAPTANEMLSPNRQYAAGITHRDLKPENVLMKSGDKNHVEYNVIKIADFGLSSLTSQVL